jgi:hypothetical protein
MSSGNQRRNVRRSLGVLAIVVGLLGGAWLWFAADQRLDDAVAGMARAPVGCDTVLDFDATGTYLVFVETTGELDDVRGDCAVDTDIRWDEEELPTVVLTLLNPEGDEVELDADEGVSYDTGDSAGESIQSIDVETPGDHTLRVESDDSGFAIAVGRNPNDGVLAMRAGAVLAALVGIAIGVWLLSSARRRRVEQPADGEVWVPEPGRAPDWPMSPPGFPAPPPTTGTAAVVGPPSGPAIRPGAGSLPTPPPSGASVAPIPGQPGPWGPPPPPPGARAGTRPRT